MGSRTKGTSNLTANIYTILLSNYITSGSIEAVSIRIVYCECKNSALYIRIDGTRGNIKTSAICIITCIIILNNNISSQIAGNNPGKFICICRTPVSNHIEGNKAIASRILEFKIIRLAGTMLVCT